MGGGGGPRAPLSDRLRHDEPAYTSYINPPGQGARRLNKGCRQVILVQEKDRVEHWPCLPDHKVSLIMVAAGNAGQRMKKPTLYKLHT